MRQDEHGSLCTAYRKIGGIRSVVFDGRCFDAAFPVDGFEFAISGVAFEIYRLRRKEKLLAVSYSFGRKSREKAVRLFACRISADAFESPLERQSDTIIIEHREMPFTGVHVTLDHVGGIKRPRR